MANSQLVSTDAAPEGIAPTDSACEGTTLTNAAHGSAKSQSSTSNASSSNDGSKKITFLTEFSKFIADMTVLEWALGWILGEVISRFLTSLVHEFLLPLLSGLLFGGYDPGSLNFTVAGASVNYGNLIVNGIDVVIIFITVFLVAELMWLIRKKHNIEDDVEEFAGNAEEQHLENQALLKNQAEVLGEIRDLLAVQQNQTKN